MRFHYGVNQRSYKGYCSSVTSDMLHICTSCECGCKIYHSQNVASYIVKCLSNFSHQTFRNYFILTRHTRILHSNANICISLKKAIVFSNLEKNTYDDNRHQNISPSHFAAVSKRLNNAPSVCRHRGACRHAAGSIREPIQ